MKHDLSACVGVDERGDSRTDILLSTD